MTFVKFEKRQRTSKAKTPRLTVGQSGVLALNKAAVVQFELANIEYVELYYDVDNKIIGVKPVSEESDFRSTLRDRNAGMDVFAKLFFDHFNIDYSETHRYAVAWDDEHEMLVAQIGGYTITCDLAKGKDYSVSNKPMSAADLIWQEASAMDDDDN